MFRLGVRTRIFMRGGEGLRLKTLRLILELGHWRYRGIRTLTELFLLGLMILPAYAFRPNEDTVSFPNAEVRPKNNLPARLLSAKQRSAVETGGGLGVNVAWHSRLNTPSSIRGTNLGQRRAFSGGKGLSLRGSGAYQADSIAVLDNLSSFFQIKDAEKEFAVKKVEPDALGFHHVRMNQTHQGLKVVGGELTVHFNKRGLAYEVNGQYVPDIDLSVITSMTPEEATRIAQEDLKRLRNPVGTLAKPPELVVFARDTEPRLAYELTLSSRNPSATPGRWRYWIDSQQGKVLLRYNDIKRIAPPTSNGTNSVVTGSVLMGEGGSFTNVSAWYENTGTYYLYSKTLNWCVYNVATTNSFFDFNTYAYRTTADWGVSDRTEMSAALSFDQIQRYFLQVHGLNSFDGAGAFARANVHEGVDYANAYWDGSAFYFGDGDGVYASSLTVLDIAGHEFTHAVTEYSANLIYYSESGALNESFSDIFGSCVEFFSQKDGRASYPARTPGQADWLCGEDSWLDSTALRDLRNPANPATVGAGNEQPARYKGTYWYYGSGDNGGVHYNSGVQNFFFYLLCEGGSGTNDGLSYSVTGIGITNAEQVAYRALTVYCTDHTDYRAVRGAWLSAAQDLNPAWASSVSEAWDAVGIQAVTITPESGPFFSGFEGGPFSPTTFVFTLINASSSATGWGVSHLQAWMSVSPGSGSIPAFGSQTVTVTPNGAAAGLPVGTYSDTLVFTNTASTASEIRSVNLQVQSPAIYTFNMDTDPGWSIEGQWSYGIPLGIGNDPSAGATGTKVYGYNLAGAYSNSMPIYALTTRSFDCSQYDNVQLSFQRWLGVESSTYDHAKIQVSTDGTVWSNVWDHVGASFQDTSWTKCVYSLPSAAGQRTVYLRWQMGPTDAADTYSGWNLDDIYIQGTSTDGMRVVPGGDLTSRRYEGGEFSPADKTYLIINGGSAPFAWTAATTSAWLTVSSPGDTLAVGATATVSVAFSAAANALTPGQYQGAVVFANPASSFTTTRSVSLTVLAIPGEIEVWDSIAPNSDTNMPFGQVIVGLSRAEHITVSNTDATYPLVLSTIQGGTNLNAFSLTGIPAMPYSILPGSNLTFDVAYTPQAAGSNTSVVIIESNDVDEPTVTVALSGKGIPDYMNVQPLAGLSGSGPPGGPFTSGSQSYTVSNNNSVAISWVAVGYPAWVSVTPDSGTLPAGTSAPVLVAFNAAATALPQGNYSGSLVLSNLTTTITQTRSMALNIFLTPVVRMAPTSITVTNHLRQMLQTPLQIGNAAWANTTLSFTLSASEVARTPLVATLQPAVIRDFTQLPKGAKCRAGELLVRFNAAATGVAVRTQILTAAGGGNIAREFKLVSGLTLVKLPEGAVMADALLRLNQTAGILYAQPNYLKNAFRTPNDPLFSSLWGMSNTGQTGGVPDADINAPEAWESGVGGAAITVAVIDTGIDYTHEDLAANMWINAGEIPGNGIDDDGNGYVDDVYGYDFFNGDADPMDDHGHGTHCSGTIGAVGDNGVGVAGVCWNVKIMALKFLSASGEGDTAGAISCIEYAVQMGAKVLSNSWGDVPGGPYEQALRDAIDAAGAANVLFVAAAGNDTNNNDVNPCYPASYESDNIISVMSASSFGAMSSFSNYGLTSVDLAAPGSSILSCKRGGGYQYMSGTSMATPHVAGACALLLSLNSGYSSLQVKNALVTTTDSILPGLCVSGGLMKLASAITLSPAWLRLLTFSGADMAPGVSSNITVITDAGLMVAGTYEGLIRVVSNDRDMPVTNVPVTMVLLQDDLRIPPAGTFVSSGYTGGPFSPSNMVYTLTNAGIASLTWSASREYPWVIMTPAGGTLLAGQATHVSVSFASPAGLLLPGEFSNNVGFSNETSTVVQYCGVSLTVLERKLDHFEWGYIAPTQYVGQAFGVTIRAKDQTDQIDEGFTNSVSLTGLYNASVSPIIHNDFEAGTLVGWTKTNLEGGETTVALNSSQTGNFTNGIWTGNVTVLEVTTNMFLRVDDGAGHIADSGRFSTPSQSVLPFAWLLQFGLPTDGSSDYTDSDNDGLSNWEEWMAGTVPTNRLSLLQIETLTSESGSGQFQVRWQSVSGKYYWVGSCETLTVPIFFTPFVSNVLGQAESTTVLDTRPPAGGSRFYRVGVQP